MANDLSLRPALPQDFAFCRRVYFATMGWIILELGLRETAERARFRRQWRVEQVRIVAKDGEDVGWLQTAPGADAIFLAQLYVDTPFQRDRWGPVAHPDRGSKPRQQGALIGCGQDQPGAPPL